MTRKLIAANTSMACCMSDDCLRLSGGWPPRQSREPATDLSAVVGILAPENPAEIALFVEDDEEVEAGAFANGFLSLFTGTMNMREFSRCTRAS